MDRTDDRIRRAFVYALIFVVRLLLVWEWYALLNAYIRKTFFSGTTSLEGGGVVMLVLSSSEFAFATPAREP